METNYQVPTNAFSVSAYLENDGAILLVEHVKQKAWVPIGGRIELNETPYMAVLREIQEETSLEIVKDYGVSPIRSFELGLNDRIGMISYDEHEVLPSGLHMCFSFLVPTWNRTIKKCDEYTSMRWLDWETFKLISRRHGPPTLADLTVPPNVMKILGRCFSILGNK